MNTHTLRTTVAAASLLLIAGCGTAVSDQASAPRSVPQRQARVDTGAAYDGWAVRLRRQAAPPACAFSPDQLQRIREAGRPMPGCARRQLHWFRQQAERDRVPNGPRAGR